MTHEMPRAIASLYLLLQLGGNGDSLPHVRLALYLQSTVVAYKAPVPIVIELSNDSKVQMKLSGIVELRRVVEFPADKRHAPVMQRELKDLTEHHITVECVVPAGSQLRHIQTRGRLLDKDIVLNPGEEKLIKAELPPDAFEIGDCSIVVSIAGEPANDGVTSCKIHVIAPRTPSTNSTSTIKRDAQLIS